MLGQVEEGIFGVPILKKRSIGIDMRFHAVIWMRNIDLAELNPEDQTQAEQQQFRFVAKKCSTMDMPIHSINWHSTI